MYIYILSSSFFFGMYVWSCFEIDSCCVAQTGLEFVIVLTKPLKVGVTRMSHHAQPILLFFL